jgi:peptidoglycan hydrolase CwlO-like protein
MIRPTFLVSVLVLSILCVGFFAHATFGAMTADEYEAQLRAQEEQELKDLKVFQDEKKRILGEKDTIERAIKLLDTSIKESQQKIKISTTKTDSLSKEIGSKSAMIVVLGDRIDKQKESLAGILRKTGEADSVSMTEILLGNKRLSDFFSQTDAYGFVSQSLDATLESVRSDKTQTEEEKATLEDRKNKEENARQNILTEQRKIKALQSEKNLLLKNKNKENTFYSSLIKTKEQNIAKIRSALFQLRDSDGISFGQAYDYAVKASQVTGVRPAFILGILMQESNLGKNVGACYVRDFDTGAGVGVNTGTYKSRVMSPVRDIPTFIGIVQRLGLSPTDTRVSCWIPMYSKGKPYGWGGAMGPAQFIPSTWKLFEKRIESAMGGIANPWDPQHAILAGALYLKDLGASTQEYSAEKNAACRYYSGKKCLQSSDGSGYGTSVMKKVQNIQECMIDPMLGKSNGCVQ